MLTTYEYSISIFIQWARLDPLNFRLKMLAVMVSVYYSLCWVLSACYLPVAVPRAVIFVFNQLLLDSISNVKYYNLFGALYRHPTIYSAF